MINSKKIAMEMRGAAFNLLARREQSQQELRVKILQKFKKRYQNNADLSEESSLITAQITEALEKLLEQLRKEGLQSDKKYREMLIRGRINQGHGFLRIAQELKHKNLPIKNDDLAEEVESQAERSVEARTGERKAKKPKEIIDLEKPVFEPNDKEWFVRARQVKQKKFGDTRAESQKALARQIRFLQYRGFNSEQIRYALEGVESNNP